MFWLRFLRLCLSVLGEGLTNLACLCAFLFTGRRVRRRLRRILSRPAGGTAGEPRLAPAPLWSFLLACALLAGVATGCRHFPGSSFGKQVRETGWTVKTLTGTPKEWGADLRGLGRDLRTLADPELDQLPQTIVLFGW
jgi:hypothetical protein